MADILTAMVMQVSTLNKIEGSSTLAPHPVTRQPVLRAAVHRKSGGNLIDNDGRLDKGARPLFDP